MRTIQKTSLKNLRNLRKLMSLASLISLISLTSLHAQVKIGQDAEPKKGTVLELNSNPAGYIGGLRLTNVSLASITDLTPFSETPEGAMVAGKFVSEDFKGAIVYNTNITLKNEAGEITGVGVYYWEGAKWVKETSGAIEPWYKIANPGNPSTANTDDSYLMAKVAIGTSTVAKTGGYKEKDAQLTVAGGNVVIQGTPFGIGNTTPRYPSSNSIAIGYGAFGGSSDVNNNMSNDNVAIGNYALESAEEVISTIAIGRMAAANAKRINSTVAIGDYALAGSSVTSRITHSAYIGAVAVGTFALENLESGDGNTAIGTSALNKNASGYYNTAVGYSASREGTSSSYNTAVGFEALMGNTSFKGTKGSGNTTLGYKAGKWITSGSNNTILGSVNTLIEPVVITSGSHNTVIGYGSTVPSATADDQISIHNLINATGATGVVTSGIGAGNVGIGTTAPQAKLHVVKGDSPAGFILQDGTQGLNKVLTSDANGVATWQPAQDGGTTIVTGTTPINVEETTTNNYNVSITPSETPGQVLTTVINEGNTIVEWQDAPVVEPWNKVDRHGGTTIEPLQASEVLTDYALNRKGVPATDNDKPAYLASRIFIGEVIKGNKEDTSEFEEKYDGSYISGVPAQILRAYSHIINGYDRTQLYVGGDANIANHTFGKFLCLYRLI